MKGKHYEYYGDNGKIIKESKVNCRICWGEERPKVYVGDVGAALFLGGILAILHPGLLLLYLFFSTTLIPGIIFLAIGATLLITSIPLIAIPHHTNKKKLRFLDEVKDYFDDKPKEQLQLQI